MTSTSHRAEKGRLVEVNPNSPSEFLRNVSESLGRRSSKSISIPEVTALSRDKESVRKLAQSILENAESEADYLMDLMEKSAMKAEWNVKRAESMIQAGEYIFTLIQNLNVRSLVHSTHQVFDQLNLNRLLSNTHIKINKIAVEEHGKLPKPQQRAIFRRTMSEAELGLTGVDYAIAETGSCAVIAKKGVSRVVSLLPPNYIALVEKGQVLPSLDEFFTIQRASFLNGTHNSYMNIISGASRSADIEQTIVKGVHGPGNVHMILIG